MVVDCDRDSSVARKKDFMEKATISTLHESGLFAKSISIKKLAKSRVYKLHKNKIQLYLTV